MRAERVESGRLQVYPNCYAIDQGEYTIAETASDFDHFAIIGTERFKEGVVRCHCKRWDGRRWEFFMVYAKDEVLTELRGRLEAK